MTVIKYGHPCCAFWPVSPDHVLTFSENMMKITDKDNLTYEDRVSDEFVELGLLKSVVGHHIRRASHIFANDFNESVAGTGMRRGLFAVLSVVSANPGIAQGKVGETLGVQRNNMATLAFELEKRGLLRRETVENDRRTLALTLTPEGQSTLDECFVKILEHEDRLLASLSKQERNQIIRLLGMIERREC